MNSERHNQAFSDQILAVAKDAASEHDAHNRFYYEYRTVMDMNAEFYRSTVRRFFKNREIDWLSLCQRQFDKFLI